MVRPETPPEKSGEPPRGAQRDDRQPESSGPPTPLRALIVEDSEDDAFFLVRSLEKGGFAPASRRVETLSELQEALAEGEWDVVVSDYVVPGFGGLDALEELKRRRLDIPFIMVSGQMGEEVAVDAMRAGAHDYIVKGNLSRLAPAIRRELAECTNRRERRSAEERILRQYRHLSALRSIDLAITSSSDLRVMLDVLLEKVTSELQVDAASILKLNPDAQKLEFIAGRGFASDALRYTSLRLGEGHAGRAALERRTVHVPDLRGTPEMTRSPSVQLEGFTTYFAAPLVARGHVAGVLEIFHRQALDPNQEWFDFLEALAGQGAIAIDSASMLLDLQQSNLELTLAYDATIEGWARALELRDLETKGHTRRVTEMTVTLARKLGISGQQLAHVRRGAVLHDVGKMAIPDGILLKAGPLNEEELAVMRRHPTIAYELLSPIPFLRPAIDIPYAHHERIDGSGYPRGLEGDEIPFSARIFAVVDVWDALRSERPYKPPWTKKRARDFLHERTGRDFDPEIVSAFLELDGLT